MKKRVVSLVLTLAMAVSAVGVSSRSMAAGNIQKSVAADEGKYVDGSEKAVKEFVEAASKVYQSVDKAGLEKAILAGGGITAAITGCTAILKMAGIIEDPTEQALGKIMDGVGEIENKLKDMDEKLDSILEQILALKVDDEEKSRAQTARDDVSDWNRFHDNYMKKLTDRKTTFNAKVDKAISAWWNKDTHDSTAVVFMDKDLNQIYVKDPVQSVPDASDNGLKVDKEVSFVVPSDVMPETKSIKFNTNTYKNEYKNIASKAILDAANGKKLIASDDFYTAWNALSDSAKTQKAREYAVALLAAGTYSATVVAMNNMSDDSGVHEWVQGFRQDFVDYCSELLKNTNGIALQLDAIRKTYVFEVDARESIETLINQIIAFTGVYGQAALTCASMDENTHSEDLVEAQKAWINTINSLSDIRKEIITGQKNYCYVNGKCIGYGTSTIKTENRFWYRETKSWWSTRDAYIDRYSLDWSTDIKNNELVDSVAASMIYHSFLVKNASSETKQSFGQYLKDLGVSSIPADFSGKLVTNYKGQHQFNLSDKYEMTAHKIIGSWFHTGDTYKIFDGSGKPHTKNFYNHDEVLADCIDTVNGAVKVNESLCSRAVYEEDKKIWLKDEMCVFYKDCEYSKTEKLQDHWETGSGISMEDHKKYKRIYYFKKDVSYLTQFDPPTKLNSSGSGKISAAHANEASILKYNVGKTAKLASASISYNGKSQKPVVKTIAGLAVREGVDYKIKVNKIAKKIGTYKATITGIGKFKGSQTLTFKIVKGTNPASLKGKEKVLKSSKLKKNGQTVKRSAIISVKNAKGKVTYKLSGVREDKNNKYFTINSKTGNVKIKKGLKSGCYELYINVKAAGNKYYKAATGKVIGTIYVK